MDNSQITTDLPKEQKVIVAQVMLDLNYSASEIAKDLKIDRSTVYRYGEKTLNDDLRQFATEIKTFFTLKQHQILAKIIKQIEANLDIADLRSLIHAYEVLKRHTQPLNIVLKDQIWKNPLDNI